MASHVNPRTTKLYDRTNMLLDNLAGHMLGDPAFCIKECPHALSDVKANAIVLRVLTKDSWDKDDMTMLAACWRQAVCSELFGGESEAERHRIQQAVETGQKVLLATRCGLAI
jgi:hypothetical protein